MYVYHVAVIPYSFSNLNMSIPDEWFCPIGRELMIDPVIGPDGITYERTNIERWLSTNSTSPMTREHIPSQSLISNIALKHTIAAYLNVNPERVGHVICTPAPITTAFTKYPLTVRANIYNDAIHVDLIPPSTAPRQPICFIAILDNSGSMGESASMAQGTESFGFTRMDLTKHATHTILETLQSNDMFALVTFSTEAHIILKPTIVNSVNKQRIKSVINSIHPDSSTNIYDGIRKASSIANSPDLVGRHIVALMMTDGYPNIDPPRGIIPTLSSMQMTNPWTLHTFGFGYNLDSVLLENIAKWGNGLFGFIPDCSMVGTVFINFLAHMLSVVVPNVELTYQLEGDTNETILSLGPVISGQSRHIHIPIHRTEIPNSATLTYDGVTYTTEQFEPDEFAICFTEYKTLIRSLINTNGLTNIAQSLFNTFVDKYRGSSDARICAILRDINSDIEGEGQIGLASIEPHYNRWGKHYMRAYLRSQELQQCMNFKDPGLQIYGGDVFHTIQTEADRMFCTLPPPIPSGVRISSNTASITNMSIFHNASSGCFHGENKILMADGSFKHIKDVVVGDIVKTPSGSARIQYTVECRQIARSQPMSHIGELCITPWHPIRIDGAWKFPADIASYTSRLINVVHNFVLDRDHIIFVGGIECCTLGHKIKGDIIEHPYFGDAILKDIRIKAGDIDSGHVCYENLKTTRNPTTGVINRWIDAP